MDSMSTASPCGLHCHDADGCPGVVADAVERRADGAALQENQAADFEWTAAPEEVAITEINEAPTA
jgi:hypothetical protein